MRYLSILMILSAMTAWGEDLRYAPHEEMGTPPAEITPEISGMAVSRDHEDVVWVHNDSGDGPLVYALSLSTGDLLSVVEMPNTTAKDCEDMAIGPGPDRQLDYLYLADIGNNFRRKDRFWIYRTPEPAVAARSESAPPPRTVVKDMETLVFAYPHPESAVFDAETLLVDPENGEITVVTKDRDENDGIALIFRSDGPPSATKLNRLIQAGTMSVGKDWRNSVTGGDVSTDGRWVIVRTYIQARLYRREPGQRVAEALLGSYTTIELATEPQGEAIAFERSRESVTTGAPTFYTATEIGPKARNPEQTASPINRYRPLSGPGPGAGQARR